MDLRDRSKITAPKYYEPDTKKEDIKDDCDNDSVSVSESNLDKDEEYESDFVVSDDKIEYNSSNLEDEGSEEEWVDEEEESVS